MVRSFMDPGRSPVHPSEFRAFAESQVPPQEWFVFAGKVNLPGTPTKHSKRVMVFDAGDEED